MLFEMRFARQPSDIGRIVVPLIKVHVVPVRADSLGINSLPKIVRIRQKMRKDPPPLGRIEHHLVAFDGDAPSKPRDLPVQGHERCSCRKLLSLPVGPVAEHELVIRCAYDPFSVVKEHLDDTGAAFGFAGMRDALDPYPPIRHDGVAKVLFPCAGLPYQLLERNGSAIR